MFYLIGLGLNLKSISFEALEACRRADKIYLENYTTEFPYKLEALEKVVGKRVISLTRIMIEHEKFVEEAKGKNIVLLVYGSPLSATTHISLILSCEEKNIDYKIIHNASIFDAVCETGLQLYKFGKTASLPKWQESYKPTSFVGVIEQNRKIKAHTLILADIGLTFSDALNQLVEACSEKFQLGKIIVASKLGTSDSKIFYGNVEELFEKEIYAPFCFILPSVLHFAEEEALERLKS